MTGYGCCHFTVTSLLYSLPRFVFKVFLHGDDKSEIKRPVYCPAASAGLPIIHAETTTAPVLENRAAQGDITKPGGARRLSGDQTEALRASLINKPAKNIILLIGDGMGDSEITAARNYAEGAGGFFKGIDALPLTGQYTHYSLDKKTGKPDYVTDSAASATAWTTGVKSYNGALGVDIHEKIIRPSLSWRKRRA